VVFEKIPDRQELEIVIPSLDETLMSWAERNKQFSILNLLVIPSDPTSMAMGYFDHTAGSELPSAAVALWASLIEKHITLDRTMEGPDHLAGLKPDQFTAMVQVIRAIGEALGNGIKLPTKNEKNTLTPSRKPLVAKHAIFSGEIFSNDNLTVKRPGSGMSSIKWDSNIGMQSKRFHHVDK